MSERRAGVDAPGGLITRRGLIKMGLMAAVPMLIPGVAMAGFRVISKRTRKLSFHNLHTGENLNVVYFEKGKYIPGALEEIDYILRDFRQNEIKPIDPALLDLLAGIHHRLDTREPFDIISGYRSPQTNAMLHANSEGVAVHSLHVEGKAIDICVPGRELVNVRRAALSMLGGGVGYYQRSGFVHVDTGRVRFW